MALLKNKLAAELLKAETDRAETTEAFKTLIEKLPIGIYFCDLKGKFLYSNKAAEEISGYKREELIDKHFWDTKILDLENLEKANKIFIQNKLGKATESTELVLTRKDSQQRVVEVSTGIIPWEGKQVIVGMVTDITLRKHMEEEAEQMKPQLIQAQMSQALAKMAGGIAHSFSNALIGISGNAGLLERKLQDNEALLKYIKPMKASVQRMTALTNQLLAFGRGGKYKPKNVSLRDLIVMSQHMIKYTIGANIRIEMDLTAKSQYIEADAAQIQMVLLSLLNNAGEAIKGRGTIRIIEKEVNFTQPVQEGNRTLKPGIYAAVSIEDTGTGMDKETKERIFEPFFSTKSRGRGLGMAAVLGAVQNHNGWITVDSEPGKGTSITLYFPTVPAPAILQEEPETVEFSGTGTILLVEDEVEVIQLTQNILETLGFNVLVATSGDEALQVVKTHKEEIRLVILDILLPDALGTEVYPLLKSQRPDLKVLVSSGYSSDGPAQEILNAGAEDFIQKPFSIKKLSEKLKKLLSGEAATMPSGH